MPADALIVRQGPVAAPMDYQVPAAGDIIPLLVTASFDGTAAAGSFLPELQLIAPDGTVIARCPIGTTLAAGASADVSWFPHVGGSSSSSGGGGARTVRVPLDTPDSSGNGYPALSTVNGWSNVRRVVPAFAHGVLGTWDGSIEIPGDYSSGGTIVLSWAINATSGNLRNRVGTSVIANNVSLDTAYTQESYASTAAPAAALRRVQSSFTLSTTLVAGSTLEVQVTRDGGNAADTLAVDALLVGVDLSYTAGH